MFKIEDRSGKVVNKGEADFDTKLDVFLSSFGVHLVVVRHAAMDHLALYQKYNIRLTVNRSEEYQQLWSESLSPALLMKALTRKSNGISRPCPWPCWLIQQLLTRLVHFM